MTCNFPLTIVKGLVEHGDDTVYFGSLIGVETHRAAARDLKLIDHNNALTDHGRAEYARNNLDRLPREGRAYMWDWSVTK